MSKPSYAAVADPAKDHNQIEAPPPYTGPSGSTPGGFHVQQHPGPHHLNPAFQHTQNQQPHGQAEGQALQGSNGWTPPANLDVARARAKRRFWVAFFWAWVIWIILGLFIGGGVSDVSREPVGRHGHWGKHGKWHDDTTYGVSLESAETVEIVESTVRQ